MIIIKTPSGFKIGDEVKVIYFEFTGRVTGLSENISGVWQVLINSRELKDGIPVKSCWFEEPEVVLFENKQAEKETTTIYNQEPKFALGEKVKCNSPSIAGIVHDRSYWLHGCTRYTILLDKLDNDNRLVYETFDEIYLEPVKAPKVTLPKVKTGGPMQHVPTSSHKG